MSFHTEFGSLSAFEKGRIEIIDDDPRHYVHSNVFDVARRARPYEKVAVAKNLEYVIECIRAEGTSPWYCAAHDEFCLVMDGEVTVELCKLDTPVAPEGKAGTVPVRGEPKGKRMGTIKLRRGHQALLPVGAAYRFASPMPSVVLQQTLHGDLTVERWAEICAR